MATAGRPRAGEGPPRPPTTGARQETGTSPAAPARGRCFVTAGPRVGREVNPALPVPGLSPPWPPAPRPMGRRAPAPCGPGLIHRPRPRSEPRCGRGSAAILGRSRAEPSQRCPAPRSPRSQHPLPAPQAPATRSLCTGVQRQVPRPAPCRHSSHNIGAQHMAPSAATWPHLEPPPASRPLDPHITHPSLPPVAQHAPPRHPIAPQPSPSTHRWGSATCTAQSLSPSPYGPQPSPTVTPQHGPPDPQQPPTVSAPCTAPSPHAGGCRCAPHTHPGSSPPRPRTHCGLHPTLPQPCASPAATALPVGLSRCLSPGYGTGRRRGARARGQSEAGPLGSPTERAPAPARNCREAGSGPRRVPGAEEARRWSGR